MSVHVMLDLETWGSGPKALPVSIGAVKFDDVSILDRFHVGIDVKSLPRDLGCIIDPDTMLWWMDEERADARREWLALEKVDIRTALEGFWLWYESTPGDEIPLDPADAPHAYGEKLPIWGNGATFDNVILRNAYDACGMEYPAPFWKDWCYRTVKNLRPDIKLQRVGTHHSAVDDAESQARHLQELARTLGVVL